MLICCTAALNLSGENLFSLFKKTTNFLLLKWPVQHQPFWSPILSSRWIGLFMQLRVAGDSSVVPSLDLFDEKNKRRATQTSWTYQTLSKLLLPEIDLAAWQVESRAQMKTKKLICLQLSKRKWFNIYRNLQAEKFYWWENVIFSVTIKYCVCYCVR